MKTSLFRCLPGLIVTLFCLPLAASTVSITAQPTNQMVLVGDTAIFNVTASGPPLLKYQWFLNGTSLAKATNASLTLTNVQTNKAGNYTVQVKDGLGSTVLSSNAVLTVLPPQLPTILAQPTNQTVWEGSNVVFGLTITGGFPPPAYQWQFNGSIINGATNAPLILTNVQIAQAGNYAVLMTNVAGSILSSNALLTVVKSGPLQVCDEADLQAAVAAGGTITFGCDGVITLTKTLAVTKPTTLDGTGHTVTVSGGNAVQLFSVNPGVTAAFINLTLANGLSAGSNGVADPPVTDGQPGMGGAIFNNGGIVALTSCIVVSNLALGGAGYSSNGNQFPYSSGGGGSGGAIYNLAGNLSVTNCSFSANGAAGGTGGYNEGSGAAGGAACGRGIYSQGGSVAIQNSTFIINTIRGGAPGYNFLAGNAGQAGSGFGGAMWSSNATVNFHGSTFTSNLVAGAGLPAIGMGAGSGEGGAIFAMNGAVNCFGCTFATNAVTAGNSFKYSGMGVARGGAIWSGATFSASQCSFLGNQSTGSFGESPGGEEGGGGAVFTVNSFSLSDSLFAGNITRGGPGGYILTSECPGGMGKGGAICNLGILAATNCMLVANFATGGDAGYGFQNGRSGGLGGGGGLFNVAGMATLVNITFVSNNAAGGLGDGSFVGGVTGGIGGGGAIYNEGTLVATNCTLAANSATGGRAGPISINAGGSGGYGIGGGLFNTNGTATLANLTYANNSAIGGAGNLGYPGVPPGLTGLTLGGAICNSNGTVNLYNTILAYSASGSNCWGTLLDLGYNLSSDISAGFYAPGSLNNTDPLLGPLGDYGGPTLTMALLPGSLAIDAIPAAKAPATDQRGRSRPYGTASDIGAFEWSPLYVISGKVSGLSSTVGVVVTAGSINAAVGPLGNYQLNNVDPGSYAVTPANANYVFVPNSRVVTLGPDQANVDFQAYHWNTINAEGISNGLLHLLYAGTNGQTYRLLSTTNLTGPWLPVSTNTLTTSNYFDVFLPMTAEPGRFYRTISP